MARARNLKPGFFKNENLAECSPWARLCFAGLWTLADRDGRLEDRPKRVKGELFAFDSIEVEPLLAELAKHGFILRYQTPQGVALIQILKFWKHQNPHHKEPKGALPSPKSLGLSVDGMEEESGVSGSSDGGDAQGESEVWPPNDELSSTPNRAESKPLIPEIPKTSSSRPAGEGRFPEFWKAWPSTDRKADRKKCLAKWQRSGWDSVADEILAHVAAMKQSRQWREGFEPAPLTYLNGERWRDGLPGQPNGAHAADDIFAEGR